MSGYKTFDLFSQLVLILIVLVSLPFASNDAVLFAALLSFAGVQIISLIIHGVNWENESWRSPLRKFHTIGTVVALVLIIFGLGIPAAAMALFYTLITYLEWKKSKQA
jgi:hypothetical protein